MHPYRRFILVNWLVMAICLVIALAVFWKQIVMADPHRRARHDPQVELDQQAEALLDVARGLKAVRHAPNTPELTALFAVQQPQAAPEPKQAVRAPAPPMPFSVDMIIAAGDQGRAIVSGRLIRIGDILVDGSRVKAIQADGVHLENKGRVRRLPAPPGRVVPPKDES